MRKLIIVTTPFATDNLSGNGVLLSEKNIHNSNLTIPTLPFSNAKKLLGQTLDYAIYDMRAENGICFNLDAFAIVAGTIIENGNLILICPEWHTLETSTLIDADSKRWSETGAITTPNFYHHFKALVNQYNFQVIGKIDLNQITSGQIPQKICKINQLTEQQQKIFEQLPQHPTDIHLLTAPRGRGKSTLLGQLAQKVSESNPVIITARSHSALPAFWQNMESDKVKFYSPDSLIQEITQQRLDTESWLFIDEAASLPLPTLKQLTHYFKKVVLSTTTQNYEGTGRGFKLKFLPQLTRSYQEWQLTKPLRYNENDPLEQFINQLLILDNAHNSKNVKPNSETAFYQLLANAHYKTTPTDLRRLFDAPNQHFVKQIENNQLIGGIWAIYEGGLNNELTEQIWQGSRRPQGNLVAQYLCFQGNLPEACKLRSIRISRIAVTPEKQQQGIGKRLVSEFILQMEQKENVDFVSVSFGLTEPLFKFWKNCGFELAQISPNKEASSGYHSAMMLYPITEKGKQVTQQAKTQFERDFALLPYLQHLQNIIQISPLVKPILKQWDLTEQDHKNLQGFANYHRSLTACYASLKRLKQLYPYELSLFDEVFNSESLILPNYKKSWLKEARKTIKQQLENSPDVS